MVHSQYSESVCQLRQKFESFGSSAANQITEAICFQVERKRFEAPGHAISGHETDHDDPTEQLRANNQDHLDTQLLVIVIHLW